MIVKNEQDFIGRCLNSIKDFADEIIIIDTGSADSTLQIAKKFTDKVHQHEWPNDFSKARNISLGYATKDWILVLDADEIISKEDLKKIKELISQDSICAYSFIQRNYTNNSSLLNFTLCYHESPYTKEFAGFRPSRLTRLFRNKKGFEFRNKVHELVEYSIEEKGNEIIATDIPIHHYAENKSDSIKKEKGKKYFELGEEQIKENPNEARAYYETGIGCLINKDFENAIEKFQKVIELNPDYKETYYNLGSAFHSIGKFDKAEEFLRMSVEKNQNTAAHNLLGKILYDKGNVNEAIDILSKGIIINNYNILLYKTLGGILITIGRINEAISLLDKGISLAPKDIGMHINLGGAYFAENNLKKAAEILTRAIEIDPKAFEIYPNLFIVYMNNREKEKAIELLNKAKEIFPEHTDLLQEQIDNINKQ